MKHAKHTPGPWRVGDAGHAVFGPKDSGMYSNAPATIVQRIPNKANARLIAAAPELLAFAFHVLQSGACQGIPGLEGYAHLVIAKALKGPTAPSLERTAFVRAAIAKATGGDRD